MAPFGSVVRCIRGAGQERGLRRLPHGAQREGEFGDAAGIGGVLMLPGDSPSKMRTATAAVCRLTSDMFVIRPPTIPRPKNVS